MALAANSITMQEAIHTLETVLRWSGIKLVPVGADQLKAVPVHDD
jgi:hypothetical protein